MEQENLEELDVDIDRTQQIKDGDDGDDGLTDDDPWAQEHFLGGDDEPIQICRKRIKRKRVTQIVLEDEDIQEDKKAAVNLPVVEDLLPTPEQGKRTGDSQYKAVELGLENLHQMVGHSLLPEDLQHRNGVNDPIRLPIELKISRKNAFNETACSLGALVLSLWLNY